MSVLAFQQRHMLKLRHISVLLLLAIATSAAFAKQPPRNFFGLRIGMEEEEAQRVLRRIARQDKEEREREEGGEQEVWLFKGRTKYKYVLVKFNQDRLSWLTVVAHPKRVRYSDVASLSLATKATDGINFSYKWKVSATKQQRAVIIIARGSDAKYLTSYSVYPTISQ